MKTQNRWQVVLWVGDKDTGSWQYSAFGPYRTRKEARYALRCRYNIPRFAYTPKPYIEHWVMVGITK